jgi:ribosomal protein S4
MDHKYLAAFDGSEQAQGRGSGRDVPYSSKSLPATPYMQMTFWPMERRLDTAIFRALFASSARQARQFVIHGAVKVNGKKVRARINAAVGVEFLLTWYSDDLSRVSLESW